MYFSRGSERFPSWPSREQYPGPGQYSPSSPSPGTTPIPAQQPRTASNNISEGIDISDTAFTPISSQQQQQGYTPGRCRDQNPSPTGSITSKASRSIKKAVVSTPNDTKLRAKPALSATKIPQRPLRVQQQKEPQTQQQQQQYAAAAAHDGNVEELRKQLGDVLKQLKDLPKQAEAEAQERLASAKKHQAEVLLGMRSETERRVAEAERRATEAIDQAAEAMRRERLALEQLDQAREVHAELKLKISKVESQLNESRQSFEEVSACCAELAQRHVAELAQHRREAAQLQVPEGDWHAVHTLWPAASPESSVSPSNREGSQWLFQSPQKTVTSFRKMGGQGSDEVLDGLRSQIRHLEADLVIRDDELIFKEEQLAENRHQLTAKEQQFEQMKKQNSRLKQALKGITLTIEECEKEASAELDHEGHHKAACKINQGDSLARRRQALLGIRQTLNALEAATNLNVDYQGAKNPLSTSKVSHEIPGLPFIGIRHDNGNDNGNTQHASPQLITSLNLPLTAPSPATQLSNDASRALSHSSSSGPSGQSDSQCSYSIQGHPSGDCGSREWGATSQESVSGGCTFSTSDTADSLGSNLKKSGTRPHNGQNLNCPKPSTARKGKTSTNVVTERRATKMYLASC